MSPLCAGIRRWKSLWLTAICLTLLWGLECNKSAFTGAAEGAGRRDYRWSFDTLRYPGSFQTLMRSLWGSSATDVYVVGENDQAGEGSVFHFDGSAWQEIKLLASDGGPVAHGYGLMAVTGFSASSVYAVGGLSYYRDSMFVDSSLVVHFDGLNWSVPRIPKSQEMLTCIDGSSSADVWAGGTRGTILHFDGVGWDSFSLGQEYYVTSIAVLSLGVEFVEAILQHNQANDGRYDKFIFERMSGAWHIVDSISSAEPLGDPRFGLLVWTDRKHLYTTAPNVQRYDSGNWTLLLKASVGSVSKRSESDVMVVGDGVYQFNGTNWYEFPEFHLVNVNWRGCLLVGKVAFILRTEGGVSIVARGM